MSTGKRSLDYQLSGASYANRLLTAFFAAFNPVLCASLVLAWAFGASFFRDHSPAPALLQILWQHSECLYSPDHISNQNTCSCCCSIYAKKFLALKLSRSALCLLLLFRVADLAWLSSSFQDFSPSQSPCSTPYVILSRTCRRQYHASIADAPLFKTCISFGLVSRVKTCP